MARKSLGGMGSMMSVIRQTDLDTLNTEEAFDTLFKPFLLTLSHMNREALAGLYSDMRENGFSYRGEKYNVKPIDAFHSAKREFKAYYIAKIFQRVKKRLLKKKGQTVTTDYRDYFEEPEELGKARSREGYVSSDEEKEEDKKPKAKEEEEDKKPKAKKRKKSEDEEEEEEEDDTDTDTEEDKYNHLLNKMDFFERKFLKLNKRVKILEDKLKEDGESEPEVEVVEKGEVGSSDSETK